MGNSPTHDDIHDDIHDFDDHTVRQHSSRSTWHDWGDGTQPPLYAPDPAPADLDLAQAVNTSVVSWAAAHGISGHELSRTESTGFGQYAALTHPHTTSPERLLLSAQWMVANYITDDRYVDDARSGAQPDRTADRLARLLAALPPLILPEPHDAALMTVWDAEPPVRLFRSALAAYARHASPAQMGRLHHETCSLFLAFTQAASWKPTRTMPTVSDYLIHRQFNTFLPVIVELDILGGWEMPAEVYYQQQVRQATLLAGAQSSLVNDLCSLDMDLQDPPGSQASLPLAIAAEKDCSLTEAVTAAVHIHNATMRLFEHLERDLLADAAPPVQRWLTGLREWMGGNLQFHFSSPRYLGTT